MTERERSFGAELAVAAIATVLATVGRALLAPTLGSELPFITFFVAIMVAAWYGGFRAGIIATALGMVASLYFFVEPYHSLTVGSIRATVGVILFAVVGIILSGFAGALHASRRAALAKNDELQHQIAERKRAEEAVRASEGELSDFFENANLGLHWVGADGTILRANREELRMLGYAADEYVGRNIAEFHVDRDIIDDILARLSQGEALRDRPARLRSKDGTIKDVVINSSVRWDNGRFVHSRCFTLDVSHRGDAERAQSLLAAVVQSSEDAIITKSLAGVITSWNAGAERLFGYTAGEAIGRPITMIIPGDRIDEERDILARLARGESIAHFETLRVAKDGTTLEISLSVSPVRDHSGKVVGASKVARNIGERKRAEVIIRESEARFRMIADNISVLAWTADPSGTSTWFNKRWFDYTGTTFESMGKGVGEQLQHPDHLSRVRNSFRKSLTSGEEWEDTFPLRGADGQYRWFLSRAVPIHDDDGKITLWFGTNVDVTERIEMEAMLRETDRRKDEFVATLAHELRNPLAPLQHSLHVLDTRDREPETVTDLVAIMQRQVTQMTRLVEDLIDISRISTGKFELRRVVVRLESFVHQALETVSPLIAASNHTITVQLPPTHVYLNADAVRLAQVLTNLLRNAAKFTDPGGRIQLSAVIEADTVVITVTDNGIGIPPDRLKSVFEMFAQGHETLEESRGGLGIGLTLVRRVVELHDGTVTATSAGRGKGSTFFVRLPVVHTSGVQTTEAGSPVTLPRVDTRFLLADDNADSVDTLAMLLRLQGNTVVTTYDGEAALAAFAKEPAGVVLLDIGMPKRSGYETCRAIRELPSGRDALIIALTGWGQAQDRLRSNAAGFDAHLVKPINQSVLLQLVRDHEEKRGRG